MYDPAVRASLSSGAEVRTPRDFDDLMDGLADSLPAYSRSLTDRLRQFRVTAELIHTAPAIAREAAHHIERLEAENMLLARTALSLDPVASRARV